MFRATQHRARTRRRRGGGPALALLALLSVAGSCRSSEPDGPPAPVAYRQQENRPEKDQMAKIENLDRLPQDYDPRLTAVLREPVPEDVIVSFYYMNASPSPRPNYRWELHRDGRLFLTRHSGKNITVENTFDRPLPKRPTKRLTDDEMRALQDQFDRAGFFEQPGLQRLTPTEGGYYVVVRARRGDKVHDVVYESFETPLVSYLYSVAG